MGKTGMWIKNLLTGKKTEKEKCTIQEGTNSVTTLVGAANPTTPISNRQTIPKEKKRWSFRRSSATNNMSGPLNLNTMDTVAGASTLPPSVPILDSKPETELTRISETATERFDPYEEAAAIMIQSTFRSYLARKALRALRALVKLQALVRGHLVRKQAKATLRCMQALLNVQARVRAQRIQMAAGDRKPIDPRQSPHHRGQQDCKSRYSYNDADRSLDENIKIVEMDISESRGSTNSRKSYSTYSQADEAEHRFSSYHPPYYKQDEFDVSPATSAMTEISPHVRSGHFEVNTAQSSPHYNSYIPKSEMSQVPFTFHQPEYAESLNYDYSLFPNYMANTESSRAKARSQSTPKCRPESSYEGQPSRRIQSIEGRNVPRGKKMQRSSSQVGAAVQSYSYPPWCMIKLDQSNASLKASECGSTSTVLTTNTYCRSIAGYEMGRYKEYITQPHQGFSELKTAK